MNISETINELRRYAVKRIDDLAKRNADFVELGSLVSARLEPVGEQTEVLSDEAAESFIIVTTNQSSYPGENFDDKLVQGCYDIAVKLLDIAVSTSGNAKDIEMTAKYLQPLFSQDDTTNSIGWDLEEYSNWYFADSVPSADKERYQKELIEDWKSVVLARLGQA